MIKNVDLSIVPGEKLLIRLWDTIVAQGIGGLLRPWQTRRTGRAQIDMQREERLALAQVALDTEDIRAGRKRFTKHYQLIEGSASSDERDTGSDDTGSRALVATAQHNLILDQMRAEVNVSKALLSAEVELENDEQEPPDRTVDDDWLHRWRYSAGRVSAEQLQILWGRVLAGEIKSPGTFSLRTLEFIKNLSLEEARRIAKVAPFVIGNDYISSDNQKLLEDKGLIFGFLLQLQDLGIISDAALTMSITMGSSQPGEFKRALISYNRVLLATHKDEKKELRLDCYRLTALGKQVLKLGSFTPNEIYLRSVGETIKRQGFKVSLAHFAHLTETEGRYFDGEDL